MDGTTEIREIRLKIHPFEIEKKNNEIFDDFRSKNSPKNRSGAESQKKRNWTETHPFGRELAKSPMVSDLSFPRRSIIQKLRMK